MIILKPPKVSGKEAFILFLFFLLLLYSVITFLKSWNKNYRDINHLPFYTMCEDKSSIAPGYTFQKKWIIGFFQGCSVGKMGAALIWGEWVWAGLIAEWAGLLWWDQEKIRFALWDFSNLYSKVWGWFIAHNTLKVLR